MNQMQTGEKCAITAKLPMNKPEVTERAQIQTLDINTILNKRRCLFSDLQRSCKNTDLHQNFCLGFALTPC